MYSSRGGPENEIDATSFRNCPFDTDFPKRPTQHEIDIRTFNPSIQCDASNPYPPLYDVDHHLHFRRHTKNGKRPTSKPPQHRIPEDRDLPPLIIIVLNRHAISTKISETLDHVSSKAGTVSYSKAITL
ncbi:hypothetical protein FMUND_316 [Fusarium mundagurra]|uniref:Uncharacterized protein n=1 Tax=Fusarium mundagurra TaxID=1567541 RepID=A0A8H5Z8F0_9HYPO|nr:hypothetical protein FMUND_316 [Fusarium mundagurra]